MAPAAQITTWSKVLCCRICAKLFGLNRLPINLSCGHTICRNCLRKFFTNACPLDETAISIPFHNLPPNVALLSIILEANDIRAAFYLQPPRGYRLIEEILVDLASYLHHSDFIFDGNVWSDDLSRPMQRKLMSLICCQLLESEGRLRALQMGRALAERALLELIFYHQHISGIAATVWNVIRSRKCQFLGPVLQEEILKLIISKLSGDEVMSRRMLVSYLLETLRDDYPDVTKTSIGHVIQLLYRASCFNLLRREGKSSLVQLKTEFRDYDALRREHDMQIVQIAQEEGLRLSTSQWSWLLYADQDHRTYMQSITDKLQVANGFEQQLKFLKTVVDRSDDQELLVQTIEQFERFANFDLSHDWEIWPVMVNFFNCLSCIVKAYVKFMRKKTEAGYGPQNGNFRPSTLYLNYHLYKTKLCRNWERDFYCPRGESCTYAHGEAELRPPQAPQQYSTQLSGMSMNPVGNMVYPMPQQTIMYPVQLPYFSVGTTVYGPAIPIFPVHPPFVIFQYFYGSRHLEQGISPAQNNVLMEHNNELSTSNGTPAERAPSDLPNTLKYNGFNGRQPYGRMPPRIRKPLYRPLQLPISDEEDSSSSSESDDSETDEESVQEPTGVQTVSKNFQKP